MLRPGEEYRDPSTLSTNEMVGPHHGIGTVGFSTLSTTGYHQGMQKAKLEKELEKELEEIKERHRKKRMPVEIEEEETEDNKEDDIQEQKYDESGMSLVDQTPIMQVALETPRYARRPVSTLKPIFEEFQQPSPQLLPPSSQPVQKPKKTKKKAADTTAKRMVMMGFPARAAMARGTVPRQGGSSGMSVKRTAIGMVDAF